MSLCNGSCGGLFFEYSCSNQHCDSLKPIRQHQLQKTPKRLCPPRSGWNPSPLCIFSFAIRATLSKIVWHSIRFSNFHRAFTNWSDESIQLDPCRHAKTPRLHPSNLQFPGQPLQLCSNGTDSASNAVACPVEQFCSCKLPFEFHHLRVHLFGSRTPQHFCSIVED